MALTEDNGWYTLDKLNPRPGGSGEVEVEYVTGKREFGSIDTFHWEEMTAGIPHITRYRYLIYSDMDETQIKQLPVVDIGLGDPHEQPTTKQASGEPFAKVDLDPLYVKLSDVLRRAYMQASAGKGKDRHAQKDEPFDGQVMADMAKRFGVGALLGQAFKKSEESQRLAQDRAVAELLGAINYLAGAIIHMEKNPR